MADYFAADGVLARTINGFTPRPAQQQMAAAVAQLVDQPQVLVCEAGTGTGKTFAYLVPALISGKKTIVSTGTRTLQDQLFHRDLPQVKQALTAAGKSFGKTAMLKGRSNYLCPHRLNLAESSGQVKTATAADQLVRIRQWSSRTYKGDIAEVNDVAEDAGIWPLVTSTADNCLGQDCPEINACYVIKARRSAQDADLLVINHYLLFSDMLLRDEGFGELLPGVDVMMLDEAHQLPEIAADFFGQSLSSRQLVELANDSLAEYHKDAGDMPDFSDAMSRFVRCITDLRRAMGDARQRRPWQPLLGQPRLASVLSELTRELDFIQHTLEQLAPRGKGLENCWQRSLSLIERLALFTVQDSDNHITWYETSRYGFMLHQTPLDIAESFQQRMSAYHCSWLFTSATLSVGQRFDHFISRLGLPEPVTARWDSPFDYAQNACLYLPRGMPQPSAPDYVAAVVDAALPVLQASRGRAFMLFTSHRALKMAAQQLAQQLDNLDLDYPVLIQGSMPRNELLQRFRQLGNAILLGTGSFWEGVDVKGQALSCVIIDKLPFAIPDDPVFRARAEVMQQNGLNPFSHYQLPNAVIALKQGVGRLIRDAKDRGLMMICDPRLLSKSYGRVFLHNLPPMRRVTELEQIQDFFDAANRCAEKQSAIVG